MKRRDGTRVHRSRALGWLVALSIGMAIGGCGAPATSSATATEAEPGITVPTTSAAEPRNAPSGPIQLDARTLPASFVVDGDVSEWSFSSGSRQVAFVVDDRKVVLAGNFIPRDAVRIGIAAKAYLPPEIGWIQRGGTTHEITEERCRYEQVSLPEAMWENGDPHPKEVVDACLALLARHREFVARYSASFVSRFVVREDGVKLHDATAAGELAIDGARFAASEPDAPQGTGFEVELPLTAMPQLAEAPLVRLYSIVTEGAWPAAMDPPFALYEREELGPWTELPLPEPVHFQPYASVRARMFSDRAEFIPMVVPTYSYHPSEPEVTVRATPIRDAAASAPTGPTGPERPVVIEEPVRLFTEVETFGEITVGLVDGQQLSLATLRGDDVIAMVEFPSLRGTLQRGEVLQVFGYDAAGWDPMAGYRPPHWDVIEIDREGAMREAADGGVDLYGIPAWDDDPEPFQEADFVAFGVVGKYEKRAKRVTWRWNASEQMYEASVIPADAASSYEN